MTNQEFFGDWMKVIDERELNDVMSRLKNEYKVKSICPTPDKVFRAFKLCSLNDLKIVMLGMDPYPQKGVATGILFGNSINTPEDKLSPSLRVIKEGFQYYCDLHNISMQFDNTMESWAKQGMLMINSSLTVEENKSGSHSLIWRPFIKSLLINLSEYNTGIVYMLFGKDAKSFRDYIGHNNHVFVLPHPAYLARQHTSMECDTFIVIKKLIWSLYKENIEWVKIRK